MYFGKMATLHGAVITVLMAVVLVVQYPGVDGQCTWPSQFASKVFQDSGKGDLTFTTTGMTGYNAVAYGQPITSWTCHDNSYFASENLLVMKSNSLFIFSQTWYAYLCWEVTTLSSVSYRYYTQSAQQENAAQSRFYLSFEASVTKAEMCNSAAGSSGAEFHMLVEQGQGASAKLTCPSVLQGRFDFDYTPPGGTQLCTATNPPEHLNGCSDKTTLTLDQACSGLSMFYATGDVYCVASVTGGSDTFVALYNPEATVDNSATYRFSCLAISSDSTAATIVYNNCTNHQTSSYAARTHSGTEIGATITLFPFLFCQVLLSIAPSVKVSMGLFGGILPPAREAVGKFYPQTHRGEAYYDECKLVTSV